MKTSAVILVLALAGLSSMMAASPSKTHNSIQKVRDARMEQLQDQAAAAAAQRQARGITTIALVVDDQAQNAPSYHQRHKMGKVSR